MEDLKTLHRKINSMEACIRALENLLLKKEVLTQDELSSEKITARKEMRKIERNGERMQIECN